LAQQLGCFHSAYPSFAANFRQLFALSGHQRHFNHSIVIRIVLCPNGAFPVMLSL
jgi:hypothetical protein